jgi:Tfp pilus assembly protein PilX
MPPRRASADSQDMGWKDERGLALPLALVTLTVLAILGASVGVYTVANQEQATRGSSKDNALQLAESALNAGISAVWQLAHPDQQGTYPSTRPATAQLSLAQGSGYYWGVYNSSTSKWTVYGLGVATNPQKSGLTTQDEVSERITVTPGGQNEAWNGLYVSPSGCLNMTGGTTITDWLYVAGSLCISGGSSFKGPQLQVTSNLTLQGASFVGASGSPISRLSVGGTTSLSGGSAIYATTQNKLPDAVTAPNPLDANAYTDANIGPKTSCTTKSGTVPSFDNDTTQNWSNPSVNLTPGGVAYSCITKDGSGNTVGQLTWNGAWSGGTLAVKGLIFFDGPLTMTSVGTVTYSGQATIYASTLSVGGGANLCANSTCNDTTWDPTQNQIDFILGQSGVTGYTLNGGSHVEAALYTAGDAAISGGGIQTGPVICNNLTLSGGGTIGPKTMNINGQTPGGTTGPKIAIDPGSYSQGS